MTINQYLTGHDAAFATNYLRQQTDVIRHQNLSDTSGKLNHPRLCLVDAEGILKVTVRTFIRHYKTQRRNTEASCAKVTKAFCPQPSETDCQLMLPNLNCE
jgi:hypothetical protein